MTAQLSCHVQNFIVISSYQRGWEQNEISIEFILWWKNHWWKDRSRRWHLWCWQWRSVELNHDDIIKWKHFPCYWPFVQGIHRSPVNSPHKDQWCRALMFSLIWAWINGWVNNCGAGDLRCHRTHYDVAVISFHFSSSAPMMMRASFWCLTELSSRIQSFVLLDHKTTDRFLAKMIWKVMSTLTLINS